MLFFCCFVHESTLQAHLPSCTISSLSTFFPVFLYPTHAIPSRSCLFVCLFVLLPSPSFSFILILSRLCCMTETSETLFPFVFCPTLFLTLRSPLLGHPLAILLPSFPSTLSPSSPRLSLHYLLGFVYKHPSSDGLPFVVGCIHASTLTFPLFPAVLTSEECTLFSLSHLFVCA